MSSPGFFLVLEGPEGAGKSTLASALAGRMRDHGIDPVVVREPGGTPVAEAIRTALLEPGKSWTPATELLYFATARADLVGRIIRPALDAGRVVVSDRFDLSTEAYQIGGRGLPADLVQTMNQVATGGLRPDLTLLLDLPLDAAEARQRSSGKARDRLESESRAFHDRVVAYYQRVEGPGIRRIDASLPRERVLERAWEILLEGHPGIFSPKCD